MGQIVGLLETPYGLHFAPNVIGRLRIGPRCVVRHHRQSQNYLLFQTYVSPVFTYHGANILRKLAEKLELSYRTTRELNNIIDNDLPGPPLFECKELDIGNEHLQFFCRNTLQCIRSLYGDPDFVQHLMFAPEQHYTNDERKCRVVNEMNTGDWWWSVQVRNITYYERELTLRISLRRPLNHANQAPLFCLSSSLPTRHNSPSFEGRQHIQYTLQLEISQRTFAESHHAMHKSWLATYQRQSLKVSRTRVTRQLGVVLWQIYSIPASNVYWHQSFPVEKPVSL